MNVAGSLQVLGCCFVGGGVHIGFKAISVYRHEGGSVWSHDCTYTCIQLLLLPIVNKCALLDSPGSSSVVMSLWEVGICLETLVFLVF